MSHELRTPLNAVIGFSDVLLDRMFGELNERQADYVRDIRDAGRHLLELINEILDLSKIEAGRMELDVGVVELGELLGHGLAMVQQRADLHAIALEASIAPDLGAVDGDELKLKQVVLNLLTNAVKFTPDGGTVSLVAERSGDGVRIAVADTGPGVPEHDREQIFEAFQRGDRSVRASAEGTGLGLTLSAPHRRAARRPPLAGLPARRRQRVHVHVARGPASTAAAPARGGAGAAPRRTGGPRHRGRPPVRRPAAALPRARRIRRDTIAADGEQGLRRGAPAGARGRAPGPRPPDDGRLGGAGDTQRPTPSTAETPVVIVSMLDEHGAGFALGAAEYLVKPVEPATSSCASLLALGARRTARHGRRDRRRRGRARARRRRARARPGWSVLTAAGGEEGLALVRRVAAPTSCCSTC